MGIEWFRDLSITILGFVTVAVLIFTTIIVYRLYRELKSVLLLVKEASQMAHDTVTQIRDGIKPLLAILAMIQGIGGGLAGIGNIFKKKSS